MCLIKNPGLRKSIFQHYNRKILHHWKCVMAKSYNFTCISKYEIIKIKPFRFWLLSLLVKVIQLNESVNCSAKYPRRLSFYCIRTFGTHPSASSSAATWEEHEDIAARKTIHNVLSSLSEFYHLNCYNNIVQ